MSKNIENYTLTNAEDLYLEYNFPIFGKIELPKTGKYYRARQTNPDKYSEFRTITIDKGKGIFAVLGIFTESGKKKSEVQSYLFDKTKWEEKEIKEWLSKHNTKASINMDQMKCSLINTEMEILNTVAHNETLDKILASKKEFKDDDLMYLKFRFVHEGSNTNKDAFEIGDLRERHTTAIYKPLDLDHDSKKIIGSIYDTEFVEREDSDNGKAGVNVFAVMYKKLFPNIAKSLKDRYEKKKLSCSMETWYEKAKCSVCGNEYDKETEYCEHLKTRYLVAENKRYLKGITFGGCGVVDNPADKDANALALASAIDFPELNKDSDNNENDAKTDAGELKNKVEKRVEVDRFLTVLREAENLYYNIVYSPSISGNGTDDTNKKKQLNMLIEEMKSLLDTVNVNKIAKGELNTMSVMNITTEELVDALMIKAKTENKDAFVTQLSEKLEAVKAEYETKLAEAKTEADAKYDVLKAEKDALVKEYEAYKANVEKANVIATRKNTLAENKIDISFEDDNTLYEMTDKVFALFVKANAVKPPVKPTTPITDVPDTQNTAVASVVDGDNTKKEDINKMLSNVINNL